jgi:rhodanese-related sulfurtransferase
MPALRSIDPATLSAWLRAGDTVLIDVRERTEHEREHIAGSRLMPLSELDVLSLPRDGRIVLYCAAGCRSRTAARRLGREGLAQLDGGIAAWIAAGLTTVRAAAGGPKSTQYFGPPPQFA